MRHRYRLAPRHACLEGPFCNFTAAYRAQIYNTSLSAWVCLKKEESGGLIFVKKVIFFNFQVMHIGVFLISLLQSGGKSVL